MQQKSVAYLLCGFVGSGKTTYARRLEEEGVKRLSIDEVVFERHGRHGLDFPEHEYPTHRDEAIETLDKELIRLLKDGRSVALDYGLWSRDDRGYYKRIAEQYGASWRLLYFKATESTLRRRLEARNRRSDVDPNALAVEDRHFAEFLTRFHPPEGEGEELVEQRDGCSPELISRSLSLFDDRQRPDDQVALAAHAAESGSIGSWLDDYLRGVGGNVPFADGLLRQPRWYVEPTLVPLAKVGRICGPEEAMPYRESEEAWGRRVSEMLDSLHAGWRPAPLICEAEELLINDGNHSAGALAWGGWTSYWAVFWASSEVASREIRALLETWASD
jgi:predicted kinase